jgi:replicative DNA helicase
MRELFSIEAEQGVVGGLIFQPKSYDEIDGLLTESMFYDLASRTLFDGICAMQEMNHPVDMITLSEFLEEKDSELFADIGGMDYVIDLMQNTPSAANIKGWANIIIRFAKERDLFNGLVEAQKVLMTDGMNTDERLQEAEAIITAAGNEGPSSDKAIGTVEAVKDYLDFLEYRHENPGIHGLETGLTNVDERLQGLKGGEFYVVAARPAMGKTTLSMNWAANIGLAGGKVYISSLEMPARQLTQRLFAYIGKIPLSLLKSAEVLSDDEQAHKLTHVVHKLTKASIKIDDQASLDVNELRTRCRREKRQSGLDLVLVDYLQLLTDRQCKNRFDEVSSISRKLKALAKELDCTVIALSQLSRKVEERADKRPILSDLRESGQIEQDADVIQFIYRDEVYNEDTPFRGIAELITAKFRDGEKGTDFLNFIGAENRFAVFDGPLPVIEKPKPQRRGFNL